MAESWFNIALLASMECLSDVLLPHFSNSSITLVRHSSRVCIDQLASGVGLDTLVRRGLVDISKRTIHEQLRTLRSCLASQGPLAERIISRYVERMDAGFSRANKPQAAEVELITSTFDKITRLEIDQASHHDILELALALPPCEQEQIERQGLASALAGCLAEAKSQWDQKVASLVDDEYDMPYIESIAMKLRARFPRADLLNVWRSSVSLAEYEMLRCYILGQCQRNSGGAALNKSFVELILPY